MNSIETLENIAITFDEGGYEPTTLGAKSGHFIEVFGDDFNTIKQELERLKKIEEAIEILKDKFNLKVQALHLLNSEIQYELQLREHCTTYCFSIPKDIYELLKEVLGK